MHSTAAYIYYFRVLSTKNDLNASAHWGKLASDILTGRWAATLEELDTLREAVESIISAFIQLAVLQPTGTSPRTASLAHMADTLITFLVIGKRTDPSPRDNPSPRVPQHYPDCVCLGFALSSRSKHQAASSSGAGATPLSSRVRNSICEHVEVIQAEEYQYHDPVTKVLYIEFDFEAARKELMLPKEVVGSDFYLKEFKDEFLDNARCLLGEAYCRHIPKD